MAGSVFGAHGYYFTCQTDDARLTNRVEDVLSTLRVSEEAGSAYRIEVRDGQRKIWAGDELVGDRFSDDAALLLLHWHVNQEVIAAATDRQTTFHAAAAQSPRGAGVILAAPMESGKTTTVTGLLRRGWSFLTDEAAAVDAERTVWAYPKPLTIDHGSWGLFPDLRPADAGPSAESWLVPATRAGAAVVKSTRLSLVIFPRYGHGTETEATALRPSQTALELAHSTFSFDRHGKRDLRVVSALARSVPAYALTIGSLDAALDTIERLEATAEAA